MTSASYDGNGDRAAATTGTSTQDFVWNTVLQIPQTIMDSTDAYIYAFGLAPAEQVNLSTGTITYLVTDSLGSVRGIVSSSGSLTATTSYDAWGQPETTGGLTADTPFGFAGGYTDPPGLIYLLHRYYSPESGQFISVDPMIEQTLDPYSYADGNPVSNDDPAGDLHWKKHVCYVFGIHFVCGLDSYWSRSQTKWIASHSEGLKNIIIVAISAACIVIPIAGAICAGIGDLVDLYAAHIHAVAENIVHGWKHGQAGWPSNH
ncbi:MAG TPA: RHS repeat-associated core domain-containing protein [Streptosporangiaceae bacterium]|nr:RHS repeat-associated core domain-containing protein [Streptosporangiaceae bacterium]